MQLPHEKDYVTNIAFDSVIFGFSGKSLKILIMHYHNTGVFGLPAGFVKRKEDLDDAVKRAVRERTGLDNIYLGQFHTFGSVRRSDPVTMRRILEGHGFDPDESYWMLDRFFSIAYYALINYKDVKLKPDFLSDSIEWYSLDQLPPLMQDHREMVDMALTRLRENLEKKLIGGSLLPERFTMKELQSVYEAILGEKLRRTTFQRKMLSLEILERHEKRYTGKAHKAPYIYSFRK